MQEQRQRSHEEVRRWGELQMLMKSHYSFLKQGMFSMGSEGLLIDDADRVLD